MWSEDAPSHRRVIPPGALGPGELFRVAIGSLRAHVLRSALTMLGIIIGVAAVIAVVALGTGAQRAVDARIAQLGTTLLQVNAQRVRTLGVQTTLPAKLTPDDARAVAQRSPHVAAVQVQQDRNLSVVFQNRNTNVRITGTTPNYLRVRNYRIAAGRMFTEAEDTWHRRVAVLGASVMQELDLLFPAEILGRNIRIGGIQFQVVGILAPQGQSATFGDPDLQVLVPFNTGRFRIFGTDRLNDIFALATSEEDIPAAMAEIAAVLRREHRIRAGQPDDFRIRNRVDFLTTMSESAEIFTLLLGGIAAVSLMVGGIGIMNIMLVSVTERTKEIGIRKALGATRRAILLQFLSESVLLCLAGGVVGVAVGMGAAALLREVFGWNTAVAPYSLALSFGFATAVGLIFGVWPARRAAVMDPIVALRYE